MKGLSISSMGKKLSDTLYTFLTFDYRFCEESGFASPVFFLSHSSLVQESLGTSSSRMFRLETVEMVMSSIVIVTTVIPLYIFIL